jgi:hypothetical protein
MVKCVVGGDGGGAGGAGAVEVTECHAALFGEEERGEYGYDLELFRQDLHAWHLREGGAPQLEPERGLTVDQALAFLREMQ